MEIINLNGGTTWDSITNKPITEWVFPSLPSPFTQSPFSDWKRISYRKIFDTIQLKGWLYNSQQIQFQTFSTSLGISYAIGLFSFPLGFYMPERRVFSILDSPGLRQFGLSVTQAGNVFLATKGDLITIPAGNHWCVDAIISL